LRKEVRWRGHEHEFLLTKAEVCGRIFWMRFDRSPAAENVGWMKHVAVDTARLANTPEQLMAGPSEVKAVLRFIHPETVTLHTLATLLSAFTEESKFYTVSENCFFLTTVIMIVLSSAYPSHLEGKLAHAGRGAPLQERIKQRFLRFIPFATFIRQNF
jgi:hypothetical protein